MAFTIPARLVAACDSATDRRCWLSRLPDVLHELEHRWNLTLGAPFDSAEVSCSWVAPAVLADGSTAVLKLGLPHFEAEHEIDGLLFWNGNPTVRLRAADDRLNAMLLEHCRPGTSLRDLPEAEQDRVIAELLRRIWREPDEPAPFRPLAAMTERWSNETLTQAAYWSDPALVNQGLALFRELPDSAGRRVLLATDLHAGNVLRAERERWLVIDPKPFVGDPAYDATQHLLNCPSRLHADPNGTIRRLADLTELDERRLRLWTFARLAAEPRVDWNDHHPLELARALAP